MNTREAILAGIEQVAPLLDRTATRSERERTLCQEAVDALHDAGLFGMWVPQEAGGLATDLVTQVDALIALARADMSAAWTLMIGNTVTGTMAARLPDAGFAELFRGSKMPVAAGSLRPDGVATPTEDGGYRVTGTWGYGSGIHHAEWIVANCRVEGGDQAGARIALAIPIAEVTIADDWHAMGLRASGSSTYSVKDIAVPASRVHGDQLRGTPLAANPATRLPLEHASVSLGGARRALDEVRKLAATKRRLGTRSSLADNPTFRRDLGRLEAEWSSLAAAVRAAALELQNDAIAQAQDTTSAIAIRLHAICTHATERSLTIATKALRPAGASATLSGHPLERLHRDLTTAAQHVMISDTAYETLGTHLLTT